MKKLFTPLLLIISAYQLHTQIIISEPFDGDVLPAGWTQETVAPDGGWLLGDQYELGSAIFQIKEHGNFIGANDKCFCDHINDFLMSPVVDLSGYSQLWLLFDYNYIDFDPQSFTLEVSTNGGDSWEVVEALSFSAGGYMGWWETKYYDFSEYAGYDEVQIGFRYSDGGEWWSFGAALDNIKLFQPLPDDISLDSLTVVGNYGVVGAGITLNGIITNYGENNLNSFTATWDDGITTSAVDITGIDVAQFEKYHFSHGVPYSPASAIAYQVDLNVSDPNGNTDGYIADNHQSIELHGVSTKPDKPGVAELATGTWCGWCVRGIVYMDSMYLTYPQDFIGIEVHNNDPMEVEVYDDLMYAYQNFLNYGGGAAYPSVFADHKYYMDPIEMPVKLVPFINSTAPVGVFVTGEYSDSTDIMEISVRANFVTELNDIDFRFNLVVKEDSVTGTGPAWEQANAYAGGLYGDMAGYELLPSYVPADMMIYNHVARYLADGWYGAESSIPGSVNDLDTFYRNYSIPIDAEWNPDHIKLVGMVINSTTGQIVNAQEVKLKKSNEEPVDTTIVEGIDDLLNPSIRIYPNPADDYAIIDMSLASFADIDITITDMAGKQVGQKSYGELFGDQQLVINTTLLQNGIYIITLRAGDAFLNKRLTVSH